MSLFTNFPVTFRYISVTELRKICILRLTFSYILRTFMLTHTFTFYCSDPPGVSVDSANTPAVEYTTRDLMCRIRGGNPSDPMSYHYGWTYRPTYCTSDTDIPPPNGKCLTSWILNYSGHAAVIVCMNIIFYFLFKT